MHHTYDTQDPFTFLSQPQGPSTSHTPAPTLIEMHPPLPTPIIQLQPPLQPHLIECGRPICTPIVQTSSFACNVTSSTTDATPHTLSVTNYTASPPVTATVTQTHKACSQTAPVTSITQTSVPLSTTIANTSTVTSQVATPTFPPVVVKQLTQPKPYVWCRPIHIFISTSGSIHITHISTNTHRNASTFTHSNYSSAATTSATSHYVDVLSVHHLYRNLHLLVM